MGGELYQVRANYLSYMDAGVAVPLSTARRTLGLPVQWLGARAGDHTLALSEIALHFNLDVAAAQKDGTLSSLARERSAALQARRRMKTFVGLAALLVLFSAGIGLASVTYVAVNERHQEIGIQRALGATRGAIGQTVILESGWLGLLGATAGVGLGLLGARRLGTVSFPYEFGGGIGDSLNTATSVLPEMKVNAEWQALVVATAVALAVAALAGYAPASEAGRLNPSLAITGSRVAKAKLRRFLTGLQLGVGIGVVLLLISIHEGIALEQLGTISGVSRPDTVYTELTRAASSQDMAPISDPVKRLVRDPGQVKAIAQACPACKSVESYSWFGQPVKRGRYVLTQGITGVTAGFFGAEGMHLVEGRFFSDRELERGERVVVLTEYAAGLLDLDKAVGEVVRIGGLQHQVVGVIAKGAEPLHAHDGTSPNAYVPVTSVPRAWASGYPYTQARLRVHLKSESEWSAAQRQLLAALAKRLPPLTMQHLELRGNIPDRIRLGGLRRAAAIRASIIGFSALVIALIGLVNMLLVSVSEQTREIGLRRALGASRPTIALGVLLEAVAICLPGCVVGLGLGVLASRFVGNWAHLSTAVPAFWIIVSSGTALLGGLLASLIPAVRAAMLHPVEALRTE
jgi:putative ABC transport system permease protein